MMTLFSFQGTTISLINKLKIRGKQSDYTCSKTVAHKGNNNIICSNGNINF